MPNATTADARAGYEVFLQLGPTATLGDINGRLEEAGLNPVSDRMYRHYRRLANAQSERYISINRFDIASAARPYESLSANLRYQYVGGSLAVRVIFPRGHQLVDAFGQAERIGESGVLVTFSDSSVVGSMAAGNKPVVGDDVRLDFLDPSRSADGRVVEVDVLEDSAHIEIEYGRLQSLSNLVAANVLPTTRHALRIKPFEGESISSLDAVGRQVFLLFELVEAARGLVNRAGQAAGSEDYAEVPQIESLSMQSPLLAIVGLPEPVAAVLAVASGVSTAAYGYERWRRMRLRNDGLEIENQSKQAQADVDTARAGAQVQALRLLQDTYGLTADSTKPLREVFDRQVLRAVQELAEMGAEIEVDMLDSDDPKAEAS